MAAHGRLEQRVQRPARRGADRALALAAAALAAAALAARRARADAADAQVGRRVEQRPRVQLRRHRRVVQQPREQQLLGRARSWPIVSAPPGPRVDDAACCRRSSSSTSASSSCMIMLLVCSTLRAQPNAAPTCSDAHSATSRPDAPARHSLKTPTSARYEARSICEGISWDCCEWSAIDGGGRARARERSRATVHS